MNDLQIFNNPDFGELRVIEIDDEPWFVGSEVARTLGYTKPQDAVARHVDLEDSTIQGVLSSGGMQKTKLINESGLYALIIMSEIPSAKKFKRWVTKEVIPSIRKTGGYQMQQLTTNELVLKMAQSNVEMERRVDLLEESNTALVEKVDKALTVFSRPDKDHWKADMDSAIKSIVKQNGLSPVKFRGQVYEELERSANCQLQSRVARLRKRVRKQGTTYREAMYITKLDAIGKDTQLRAIFEGIIKKYQARYAQKAS